MAIDVGANNATGTLSPRNSAFLLRNMASPRNIASPRSMESPRSMTLAQSTVASKYHAAYPPFKSTLPKRNCYFLGIWWLLALLLISQHVPRNSTISTQGRLDAGIQARPGPFLYSKSSLYPSKIIENHCASNPFIRFVFYVVGITHSLTCLLLSLYYRRRNVCFAIVAVTGNFLGKNCRWG